jgi:antitoxin HicB
VKSEYRFRVRQLENGDWMAQSVDVPEALTCAAERSALPALASDALLVALSGYMERKAPVPQPGPISARFLSVHLPVLATVKLSLYEAMRSKRISQNELGRRLGWDARQVRRALDLDHHSRMDLLEQALRAVGLLLKVELSRTA